jgi:bifunctional non-homologous end joining protein LigD
MVQRVDPELRFVTPMECKEVREEFQIPTGADWQYEIKFDGYRCIAIKQKNEVELFSRRGLIFKFLNLYDEIRSQPPKSFILDGEVVALDKDGRSEFNALQHAVTRKLDVHFYAFDLLNLNGEDLKIRTLAKRQELMLESFTATSFFHLTPPLTGRLKTILRKIREFGFEGIVAKNRDSVYVPGGRPGTWLKKKLKASEEFIVGGFIPSGKAVDQLIVGRYQGKRLMFVASLDDGFVPTTRRHVFEQLAKLETDVCPFQNLPEPRSSRRSPMDREKMAKAVWVRPKIVAELAFNEWTPDHHLRHAEFKRLRDDMPAQGVPAYPE